jgi:hypothetical protein
VNPTMIGLLDNANYSNVREFRRMLYGDTLGPIIASIEDRLNTFYIPLVDPRPGVYCEFNIDEKLQGNFEEQQAALSSSVGRPWMTANEARALRNMPSIEGQGADELVTPLNVLVGGQASPTDAAPPPKALGTKTGNLFLLKARVTERQVNKLNDVLAAFFARQGKSVLSAIGSGRDDWWDHDRWNSELAQDLHATYFAVTRILGTEEARALGFSDDDYDPLATVNYLQAVADRYANNINTTTHSQLQQAVKDPDLDPASVFTEATDSRAAGIATGMGTFLAGFATSEAAQQIARTHDVSPSKTWMTGTNPRESHAQMDGETVGIDDTFSNGLSWPGAAGSDAAETANCNCSVLITLA